MSLLSRITNVFRSGALDRDLADELQFHVEARTADLIRRGLPPAQAVLEARRQLGNQLHHREGSRDAKLLPWLDSLAQDVRFGLRMLRKTPAATAAAMLALALSIGACTAAFTLVDALMFRSLPVRHPERLIEFSYPGAGRRPASAPKDDDRFAYPLFERFREASGPFAELFAIDFSPRLQPVSFDRSSEGDDVRIERTSADAFGKLGIVPALGRILTAQDDASSAPPVAMLSYAFWERRFGADPAVIGRRMTFDGKQFQIVGVARQGFSGFERAFLTDAWIPVAPGSPVSVWGLLKPGVEPERVRQAMQAVFTNFGREHPDPAQGAPDPATIPLHVQSASQGRTSPFQDGLARPLLIMALVAGLVLLIACSNIANLFMARAAAREQEIAMRSSIGASRGRLIQQMLVETFLLAAVACLLGLAFAQAAAPEIINRLMPVDYPAYLDLRVNPRVFGFLSLLGLSATLLLGLVPAMRASSVSPARALLQGGGKASVRVGFLRPLLAAQVAFSFVVLFLSGLLLLSFQKLMSLDLGFSKDRLLLVSLRAGDLRDPAKSASAGLQLLDHMRQMPGVQAAGLSALSLVGGAFTPRILPILRIPGREREVQRPTSLAVSPGFFNAMQIRLLDGREFLPSDVTQQSPAVVVNEAFASLYFPGERAVGKRFERMTGDGPRGRPLHGSFAPQEIVGVVRNAKYNNLREDTGPTFYSPLVRLDGATLEVRTEGDPLAMASLLRREIERANRSVHADAVISQAAQIESTLLPERLCALVAGFFAIVAVVLAAVGLYGVITYAVVRRTREIGIRLALGAGLGAGIRPVIADVAMMTAAGLIAGMAGGLALAKYTAGILFEVKPFDFWSLALPLSILILAAAFAALGPTLRAIRIDPVVALRCE